MTTPADLAPFTPEDLHESRSRLERLAQLWRLRLVAIPPEELDRAESDAYTLHHVLVGGEANQAW